MIPNHEAANAPSHFANQTSLASRHVDLELKRENADRALASSFFVIWNVLSLRVGPKTVTAGLNSAPMSICTHTSSP